MSLYNHYYYLVLKFWDRWGRFNATTYFNNIFYRDGAAVLKGVLKRGNQVLTESLHKISKLTADIGRVEVEISELQKRVETVDETIFNDDRTTGSDTGTPSPTVSRRRGNQQTRLVETDPSNANSGVFDNN